MRAFIALELPQEIIKELARLQDLLPDFKGKKIEAENLHLTLKFLGEVSPETLNQIKERLKKVRLKGFKVHLGELGVFTPKLIKIVWIKLVGSEKLQEEIDKVLEPLFKKESRFMSHITLARVKSIQERKNFLESVKNLKAQWLEFPIEKFILKDSKLAKEKPVYEDLEVYKLN